MFILYCIYIPGFSPIFKCQSINIDKDFCVICYEDVSS